MGAGRQEAGRKRRGESGGKKLAGNNWREERGVKTGKKWREDEEGRGGRRKEAGRNELVLFS